MFCLQIKNTIQKRIKIILVLVCCASTFINPLMAEKVSDYPQDIFIKWIDLQQNSDGSWGKGDRKILTTSIAICSFLNLGYSETVGPYKKTIRKGIEWLKLQQLQEMDLLTKAWVVFALAETATFGSQSDTREIAHRLMLELSNELLTKELVLNLEKIYVMGFYFKAHYAIRSAEIDNYSEDPIFKYWEHHYGVQREKSLEIEDEVLQSILIDLDYMLGLNKNDPIIEKRILFLRKKITPERLQGVQANLEYYFLMWGARWAGGNAYQAFKKEWRRIRAQKNEVILDNPKILPFKNIGELEPESDQIISVAFKSIILEWKLCGCGGH